MPKFNIKINAGIEYENIIEVKNKYEACQYAESILSEFYVYEQYIEIEELREE